MALWGVMRNGVFLVKGEAMTDGFLLNKVYWLRLMLRGVDSMTGKRGWSSRRRR